MVNRGFGEDLGFLQALFRVHWVINGYNMLRFSVCLLAAAAPCVRDILAVQAPSIYCLRSRSVVLRPFFKLGAHETAPYIWDSGFDWGFRAFIVYV